MLTEQEILDNINEIRLEDLLEKWKFWYKWHPVLSSNVKSVHYDEPTQTMQVIFTSNGKYEYYNVPEFVYQDLIYADSVGSYFFWNIRGYYQYKKLR